MAINAQATQARGRHAVQFIDIDENTADTFTLAAAPGAGKRIAVLSIRLNAASASQTATLKSDTAAIFGAIAFAAGGSIEWSDTNVGICACDTDKALKLTTAHASQISGMVSYIIEDAL